MSDICVSIVSHKHDELLPKLLQRLSEFHQIEKVVLTHNVPHKNPVIPGNYRYQLVEIDNDIPAGFASNHNKAYTYCDNHFFCILNPDVVFRDNPFSSLLSAFDHEPSGVAAPIVINSSGGFEDSARDFPTPFRLLRKLLFGEKGLAEIDLHCHFQPVDWVAGMFLLCRSSSFSLIGGLDEDFFLYYEDVDFSLRMWKSGLRVGLVPGAFIIHDGQRDSHVNPKYMAMHFLSMVKFFSKHLFRFPPTVDRK